MFSPAVRIHAGGAREIYVHCATSVPYLAGLNASIPGVERYAERALLLAEREDVVCTTDEVDPDYLEYLVELGLGPKAGNLVVASRFDEAEGCRPLWQRLLESPDALDHLGTLLGGWSSARLHPFIASAGQFELARSLEQRVEIPVRVLGGDADLVEYSDHKHHVRAKAIELGVPVAPGEVVDLGTAAGNRRDEVELLRSAIARQIARTGRVIVRGTSGAAGSSTFVAGCHEATDLAWALATRSDNRIYLVESMVEATVSPNVQMYIDPASWSIECRGITDQRWDRGLIHGGSAYPSVARRTADMVRWAHTLSDWLRNSGYLGTMGFDFVEYVGRDGAPSAFLAELNPRVNGATYPLRVIERLNASQHRAGRPEARAFLTGTVKTEARSFCQVREMLKDLLFSPGSSAGVVPYVPGGLPHGKCSLIALAGASLEAVELYGEAQMVMEGTCVLVPDA